MRARRGAATIAVACAATALAPACTFAGLGNYDVEVCARPTGSTTTVQQIGAMSTSGDVGFASANGKDVVAAFAADVTGGTCIEGVGEGGYLDKGCSFLADELSLVPRQPTIVPLGGGHGAAVVATTAPCTQGQLLYRYTAPGTAGASGVPCNAAGAALPSLGAFADGSAAVVAWYATTLASRTDPIAACGDAKASPLMVAVVSGAATGTPVTGAPLDLSDTGVSVRAAAVAAIAGQPRVVVAAPHGNDVGLWALDATPGAAPPVATPIPSLAGARAVSIALSGDGSGRIAVVAEIGCAPQRIALAIGTVGSPFGAGIEVAPAGKDLAVQPTVAWVDESHGWVVAWISSTGGPHALARAFDGAGNARGGVVDPGLAAASASVTSAGDVFAFSSAATSFVDTSLGCAP